MHQRSRVPGRAITRLRHLHPHSSKLWGSTSTWFRLLPAQARQVLGYQCRTCVAERYRLLPIYSPTFHLRPFTSPTWPAVTWRAACAGAQVALMYVLGRDSCLLYISMSLAQTLPNRQDSFQSKTCLGPIIPGKIPHPALVLYQSRHETSDPLPRVLVHFRHSLQWRHDLLRDR